MGKGGKVTVGYWYLPLYHAGLSKGPIDAFLEFRGGDKPAWQGNLTSSGTIRVDAPNLWGGEKDQGGIVSDVDVMFGESTQEPNAYLLANLGDQVPAWRGLATLVFKGGKYGAMNPYPQKASYKICKIKNGWDGDGCWYPEKAAIVITEPIDQLTAITDPCKYKVTAAGDHTDYSSSSYDDSAWPSAPGGFGNTAVPGGPAPSTFIPSVLLQSIWLRKRVVRAAPDVQITVTVYRDDGATLWWNGEEVALVDISYYKAQATIPLGLLADDNVVVLRTQNGIPSGTAAACYAGLEIRQQDSGLLAMNPAHVLFYSRTNSEMGREPVASMNDTNLRAAADWFYTNGFGVCTTRDPQQESPADFENRICKLIGGSFTRSLTDGQWYLDIANGEYTLADLPVLTDDDILDYKELPSQLDNAVNSVSVKYFDPLTKEDLVTAPVRALGLISAFGTIQQVNEYPEVPTAALALRLAQRDVLTTATPTRAFDLVVTRKVYSWRPNQYFRLQVPKRGIADMVCIVGELQHGTLRSGAIKLKATQDIYGLPLTTYVEHEPGVDTRPSQTPTAITEQRAFEVPYIELVVAMPSSSLNTLHEEAGFASAVSIDPSRSRNFTMMVAPDGGQYAEAAAGDWCPSALSIDAADRIATTIDIESGYKLSQVDLGMPALWDDEIVRVDAIDADAGTVTVGRGCADTVPMEHAAGSRIWFYRNSTAADTTEYTADESINIKLLTNTGSRQLNLNYATTIPLLFAQRWSRPYPPANVKISLADWPDVVAGAFAVSWASRNRLTQADQLVDNAVASISAETTNRYGLRFRRVDTGAVLVERSDIGQTSATVSLSYTGDVLMELWSLSDSGVSWQSHVHQLSYTAPAGAALSTIDATTYVPVDESIIVDGGGDGEDSGDWGGIVNGGLYPMLNDGSKLIGKVKITLSSGQEDRIASSADDGVTWALGTHDAGFEVANMAFGGGRYVAIGGAGWFGYASTVDGAWTSAQKTNYPIAGITGGLGMTSLLYNGTKFVAAGACGIIVTSTDGVAWTEVSSNGLQTGGYGSGSFRSMILSGGMYYAIFVANGGYPEKLYSSADLQSWTLLYTNSDTTKSLKAVRVLNSKIILVGSKTVSGNGRPLLLSSADGGTTWIDGSPAPSSGNPFFISLSDAAYFSGRYLIFGQNLEGYSSDLSTWTLTEPIAPQTTSSPAFNATALVTLRFASYTGLTTLRRTTNGTSWSTVDL